MQVGVLVQFDFQTSWTSTTTISRARILAKYILSKSKRQRQATVASGAMKKLCMRNFARLNFPDKILLERCLTYDLLKLHLQK